MSTSSNLPAGQYQADPSAFGGGPNRSGNGDETASSVNDKLSGSEQKSGNNGVNSENGSGNGSAGIGDQSVNENEKQARGNNEDNAPKGGEGEKKPDTLEEYMELLGLKSAKEGEGSGKPAGGEPAAKGGGGDSSCGDSGGGGGGSPGGANGAGGGGSGGGSANGAGGGSGGEGSSEGGSNDPSPVGEQQAESMGGDVKFHAENPEDAEQLKDTFDEMVENDPDFKEEVEKKVDEAGSLEMTAKDLEGNTAGIATVGGNETAIDTNQLDNKDTIAHEVLHNMGHGHGSEHDAAIEETIDGK